jgi:recombination protein RecA
VKNKVAAPFTECELDIMYNEGISSLGSLVDLATSEGIIEKKGSWFSFEGAMLGQGKDSTKKALLDDAVLRKKIEDLVAQKVTVEVGRTLGGQEVESAIE